MKGSRVWQLFPGSRPLGASYFHIQSLVCWPQRTNMESRKSSLWNRFWKVRVWPSIVNERRVKRRGLTSDYKRFPLPCSLTFFSLSNFSQHFSFLKTDFGEVLKREVMREEGYKRHGRRPEAHISFLFLFNFWGLQMISSMPRNWKRLGLTYDYYLGP